MEKEVSIVYGCTTLGTVTTEVNEGLIARILSHPEQNILILDQASQEDVSELNQRGLVTNYNPSYRSQDLEERIEEVGSFRLCIPKLNGLLESKKARFEYNRDCNENFLEFTQNIQKIPPW